MNEEKLEEKLQEIIAISDTVTLPRAEYNELINARLGIAMIGCTLGKYGPEDKVVLAVCKQFGYEYKEEPNAE